MISLLAEVEASVCNAEVLLRVNELCSTRNEIIRRVTKVGLSERLDLDNLIKEVMVMLKEETRERVFAFLDLYLKELVECGDSKRM